MNKHVVIIGGGPAGMEAARAAALAGAQVSLVSDGPLGGRAGWHSLLPSKVWLTVADAFSDFMIADQYGLNVGCRPEVDMGTVLGRIRDVAMAWNLTQEAELEALGVTILIGRAAFKDSHTLLIQKKLVEKEVTLPADAVIIATGSVPLFPAGMEPDGTHIIAPRFARLLETLPEHMLVIGAGPTGSEFAYLFNRLGLAVTWIYDAPGVLPGFSRPAAEFLGQSLDSWGVHRVGGQPVTRLEKHENGVVAHLADGSHYAADMAFIAVGRQPDLSALNLPAAGLDYTRPLAVDAYNRTIQEHIYLVGDATGSEPLCANRALAQAWVAGNHVGGGSAIQPFRPESVVSAVYTDPEVAQVGQLSGPELKHVRLSLEEGLKTHLLPEAAGFIELAYAPDTGRIMGAAAVGPHAADMLAPVGMAIHTGATLTQLAGYFPAYPTWAELPFMAMRKAITAP